MAHEQRECFSVEIDCSFVLRSSVRFPVSSPSSCSRHSGKTSSGRRESWHEVQRKILDGCVIV